MLALNPRAVEAVWAASRSSSSKTGGNWRVEHPVPAALVLGTFDRVRRAGTPGSDWLSVPSVDSPPLRLAGHDGC
jgi:hypothetical protein